MSHSEATALSPDCGIEGSFDEAHDHRGWLVIGKSSVGGSLARSSSKQAGFAFFLRPEYLTQNTANGLAIQLWWNRSRLKDS